MIAFVSHFRAKSTTRSLDVDLDVELVGERLLEDDTRSAIRQGVRGAAYARRHDDAVKDRGRA